MHGNPFSTARWRPGSLPFRFPSDHSSEQLVDRLEKLHWRGQIVGPHGSGKSTLLATLAPGIADRGREVIAVTLSGGQTTLPDSANDRPWSERTQLLVDGYEQLGILTRWQLHVRLHWAGAGLLATTHIDLGLPTLYETHVDPAAAEALVADLLVGYPPRLSAEQVRDVLAAGLAADGNFRDALFALYDAWERAM